MKSEIQTKDLKRILSHMFHESVLLRKEIKKESPYCTDYNHGIYDGYKEARRQLKCMINELE